MARPPATLNKQKQYRSEENAQRFCFYCSGRKVTNWRMIGYDEFGELWICQHCWDQAIDTSQAPPDAPGKNEQL
jgi:hypothetical protein